MTHKQTHFSCTLHLFFFQKLRENERRRNGRGLLLACKDRNVGHKGFRPPSRPRTALLRWNEAAGGILISPKSQFLYIIIIIEKKVKNNIFFI